MLIIVANGVPILAFDLLRQRFAMPLDLGVTLPDGERLFGSSKTVRGLLLAPPVTALVAELIGISWQTGITVALWAMAGDLLSSFIKRRLHMDSGSRALAIDQLPESLFPMLAVAETLSLTGETILATVIAFSVLELVLSRILYRLHLRQQPY